MGQGIGEIYHIINRGVDKRIIFQEDEDYLRFIHDLFEFNDEEKVNNVFYAFNKQYKDIRYPYIERRKRKLIVELMIFSLMPNHFHLMVRPLMEGALSLFMRKINGGYSRYFNHKYERSGALFQSRYQAVLVSDDAHFLHLPYYIHCNPLDLKYPEWRGGGLSDYKGALKFLEGYRWSSLPDYLNIKNFPSVTQREFLLEFYKNSKENADNYKEALGGWFRNLEADYLKINFGSNDI